jgi:predicted RNA-binding protein YlxR (DUF448 family)
VACGAVVPKRELVRLALRGDHIAVDHAQREPGRGAYVCGRDCLAEAVRRRLLQRAFRRPVSIDAQTVESVG